MSCQLTTLADDLTAELATGSFTTSFAPERSYADDEMQLTEAGDLRVDVVVVGHDDVELADRAHLALTLGIDIGIRRKFTTQEQDADGRVPNATIDPFVLLVEELLVFVAKKRLSSSVWRDSKVRSTIVREHLRDWRQFTGIIRIRFNSRVAL
jgi:hypothetical protein